MTMSESSSTAPPSATRRVLFVDDDVAFLGTVSELMSVLSEGHWEVLTAESASRAFAVLQSQTVDLAVIDVQMGVMDGIQMLSMLNRGYPNVQKVVLTGHASEKYRAACLSNGAELYLEKPTNPAGWQSLYGVLNELVKLRPEEGFRGVLRKVGLQDVLQMECLARSSSVLEISNARASGSIFIETGQIIHAEVADSVGEEAFNQILALSGGQFNLKPFREPSARTITGQWEFLLMEAARKSDEAKEALAAAPPVAPVAPEKPTPISPEVAAAVERIMATNQAAEAIAAAPPPAPAPGLPELPPAVAPAAAASSYQPVPVLAPGVSWRPKVDEMLILSAQGEVLYQWQCPNVDVWVSFFEFASQRGQRLAQVLPLGDFDRLEIQSGGARAVILIGTDRGVLVKTRREAINPLTGAPLP
jgi:CheY-like chemotaxis protein